MVAVRVSPHAGKQDVFPTFRSGITVLLKILCGTVSPVGRNLIYFLQVQGARTPRNDFDALRAIPLRVFSRFRRNFSLSFGRITSTASVTPPFSTHLVLHGRKVATTLVCEKQADMQADMLLQSATFAKYTVATQPLSSKMPATPLSPGKNRRVQELKRAPRV